MLRRLEGQFGKRKLIVCFGVIIILAIAFLYYESIYNLNNRFKPFSSLTVSTSKQILNDSDDFEKSSSKINYHIDNSHFANKTKCWNVDTFSIDKECHKCDLYSLKFLETCKETGYIEKINCKKLGNVTRSCNVPKEVISRRYWSFEFICLVFTAIFSSFVINRKRFLDKQAMERMRQQIQS